MGKPAGIGVRQEDWRLGRREDFRAKEGNLHTRLGALGEHEVAGSHLGEKIGEATVVRHCPAVHRMIVTAGTFQADAEEGKSRALAQCFQVFFLDVAGGAPVMVEGGAVSVGGVEARLGFDDRHHLLLPGFGAAAFPAGRQQDAANDAIIGHVVVERLRNQS